MFFHDLLYPLLLQVLSLVLFQVQDDLFSASYGLPCASINCELASHRGLPGVLLIIITFGDHRHLLSNQIG